MEPARLADALRDAAPKRGPIGPWLREIADETHQRNLRRVERVRRYPDLIEILTEEGIDVATWAGYIPPEYARVGTEEILRNRAGVPHATLQRAAGALLNDAPALNRPMKALK